MLGFLEACPLPLDLSTVSPVYASFSLSHGVCVPAYEDNSSIRLQNVCPVFCPMPPPSVPVPVVSSARELVKEMSSLLPLIHLAAFSPLDATVLYVDNLDS